MAVPTVLMFSGQGSQYYGMGSELYEHEPVFRQTMGRLDAVAAARLGSSVVELLYHSGRKKSEPFDDLARSSAAIFMVEYALACTLAASGVAPRQVLGVSLGMFAAASVAGALAPEAALAAVLDQAGIIERSCAPGAMLGVLASPALYEQHPKLFRHSELAGISGPGHSVLACPASEVRCIVDFLRTNKVAFQQMPVGYAFHSRWIDPAREGCMALYAALPWQAPRLPLVCCAAHGVLDQLSPDRLWAALRLPIQLASTIGSLEAGGPRRYLDAGPASTLATMLGYVLGPTSTSGLFKILSMFAGEHKSLERVRETFLNETTTLPQRMKY